MTSIRAPRATWLGARPGEIPRAFGRRRFMRLMRPSMRGCARCAPDDVRAIGANAGRGAMEEARAALGDRRAFAPFERRSRQTSRRGPATRATTKARRERDRYSSSAGHATLPLMAADKTDKRKQSLYFPETMLDEIKEEASRLNRSLSWVVQRAWKVARSDVKKLPSVNDVDG